MVIFGWGYGVSELGGIGELVEIFGCGWLIRLVIGWVGVVVVVVLLVGFGWCGWVFFEKYQIDVVVGQVLQVVCSYVVKLVIMDCEWIDYNMRDIFEGLIGEFKDKYGKFSVYFC